ncbi:hypothetical protein [Lysobacter capsici]|uniref:hypothetical protein n=1 Tax=Lysobacter capsici TaxID=435897 RepID=UPI0004492C63|nr:hypothetical protein [Lysobacter capsici]
MLAWGNTDELIAALCVGEMVTYSLMLARLIAFVARKSLDVRLRRSKAEPAFAGMTGWEWRGIEG